MKRVGRIVHQVSLPGDCLWLKWFWLDGSRPEFDLLLVRPDVVDVAKSGGGTTYKATCFSLEHPQHALYHWRIEQYIIVKVVYIRCVALLEQEVSLFSHAASWQVAVQRYSMTMPPQCSYKRLKLNTFETSVFFLGLIRDDYIEIGKGLAEQAS